MLPITLIHILFIGRKWKKNLRLSYSILHGRQEILNKSGNYHKKPFSSRKYGRAFLIFMQRGRGRGKVYINEHYRFSYSSSSSAGESEPLINKNHQVTKVNAKEKSLTYVEKVDGEECTREICYDVLVNSSPIDLLIKNTKLCPELNIEHNKVRITYLNGRFSSLLI